jgi:hypothetical protein
MKNTILIIVAVLVVIGVFVVLSIGSPKEKAGAYDEFALCLEEKGAIFYGAFWCSHCQNQKKFFGKSAKLLPYVECSTPDGRGQLQACKDKEIEGYPTWEFADGSRQSGELSLATLAEKTGCSLPEAK